MKEEERRFRVALALLSIVTALIAGGTAVSRPHPSVVDTVVVVVMALITSAIMALLSWGKSHWGGRWILRGVSLLWFAVTVMYATRLM